MSLISSLKCFRHVCNANSSNLAMFVKVSIVRMRLSTRFIDVLVLTSLQVFVDLAQSDPVTWAGGVDGDWKT